MSLYNLFSILTVLRFIEFKMNEYISKDYRFCSLISFEKLEDEIEVFMKPIVSGLRLKIDNYAVFINRACEMP